MRTAILILSSSLLTLAACRSGGKVDQDDADLDTGALSALDEDGDGFTADEDCDDGDASVNSGATEVCDGIDNNCDGQVDEGVTSTWYADQDGDSYGDPNAPMEGCSQPPDSASAATDCDDTDAAINPTASERCDGVDNNCNGEIDEDTLGTWYADADGDGWGDPDSALEDCDPPSNYVDNDGDCNDTTAAAAPDADEVCDGLDNDCDELVDEPDALDASTWYTDGDGDGFGDPGSAVVACDQPSATVADNTDCDDSDVGVNPSATEVCNGIDDDCDALVDDADSDVDLATGSTWYTDADTDGYGDASAPVTACVQPAGTTTDTSDCDDGAAAVNPGATEICNSIDDDCDGLTDDADTSVDLSTGSTWYTDADSDGYGDASAAVTACTQPAGTTTDTSDCDDGTAAVNPGATEVCNSIDDDCDTLIDDDDSGLDTSTGSTWYTDADSDGYGNASSPQSACVQPSGTVTSSTDCDDGAPAINPGATEICDSIDNDCDTLVDDDDSSLDTSTGSSWYVDADSDGFGDPSSTVQACTQPSGSSTDNTDCDDTDATIRPDTNGECALGETCYDILDLGRSTGDGDYVIDPDGYGTGLDPFEVYCDMTTDGGGWTEIAYADDLTYQQHFSGGDAWSWQPTDFTFELSDAQITAIQALSTEGSQLYEGRCEHVIHYYYSAGATYSYAFGFEFFDGTTTPRGSSSYAPYDISVTSDGCAGNGGEGGSLNATTDFEISSVLVPVRNVQCRDCGDVRPESFGSLLTDNPAWLR